MLAPPRRSLCWLARMMATLVRCSRVWTGIKMECCCRAKSTVKLPRRDSAAVGWSSSPLCVPPTALLPLASMEGVAKRDALLAVAFQRSKLFAKLDRDGDRQVQKGEWAALHGDL